MIEKRNDCVDCPQGCINCGKQKDYQVYVCDKCDTSENIEPIYKYRGKHYCQDCLLKELERDGAFRASEDVGECACCEHYAELWYDEYGRGYCAECILQDFEKVRASE